jgi:uncharacterized RDD family membrane protein YckC
MAVAESYTGVATNYAGFGIRFVAWIIDVVLLGIVYGVLNFLHIGALDSLAALAYYTYLIGSDMGASVGMMALGLKVIPDGGNTDETIGFMRAFIRWLVSIVSGIAIGIGYLWIIWDPKKQAWHDKAANSVVVRTR